MLEKNAKLNLYLAYIRMEDNRSAEALPLLKKALALGAPEGETRNAMSRCYRKLRNYQAALASADAAMKIEGEEATAHYNRACALARLNRRREALASLLQAIELEDSYIMSIAEEEDLKPLAAMVEFKKLIERAKSDDQ